MIGSPPRHFAAFFSLTVVSSAIGLLASELHPTILVAATPQQTATTEGRANPSPWRPAFGAIDAQAAAATRNVVGQNDAGQATPQSVDLSPPDFQPPSRANATEPASPFNQAQIQPAERRNAVVPAAAQLPINRPPAPPADRASAITRVTRSLDTLPNSAGQVWREYDISPYTSRVRTVDNPQQAIIDWVLRETGSEMWFNQPLGVLNANRNQLRVYHTPEIHNVVKPIVDRFVRTQGQMQSVDVNLVTVGNPNWRSQSYSILQSIDVQSPGVEAWLVSKENAAMLMNGLSKRADYRQHSGGRLTNHDGQTLKIEKTKPVQFVRNLKWVNQGIAGGSPSVQPEMTTINEGYRLAISCLSSLDNRTIEASVQCDVDQVEKLNNVKVNVPDAAGNPLQMNLQIPQLVSWRLKERFRWPADQVLLLGCGVVANPEPKAAQGSGFPRLGGRSDRAEALLFIDYRGPTTGASMPQTASKRLAPVQQ